MNIENAKIVFIDILRELLNNKDAKLMFFGVFSEEVNDFINKSGVEVQLSVLADSFPTSYDDNVAEKDIENLWWFIYCPAIIGWRKDNGEYIYIE